MNKIFVIITISLLFTIIGNQAFAQLPEFNPIHLENPVVILETNMGKIVIGFFPTDAPNHVQNFITLIYSGFYDGTIFHRIIPGFMIQGGDPNTIDGDSSTWGQGGPEERIDAEFNTIKHNRGIVSMARSTDPNSGGSQFFIVHKNSNFLDEQYTVFGRIITEESFETLDKIAAVETGEKDIPKDSEQVKIIKTTIANRADIPNIINMGEPERTQSTIPQPTGNQKFDSTKHNVSLSFPEGWLLQEPDKTQENSPDIIAVGPKTGMLNPYISLTVLDTNQRSLNDLIFEKNEILKLIVESGNLEITLEEDITVNGNEAHITEANSIFSSNGESISIKFKEVIIHGPEKFFIITYTNGVDNFNSQLPRFEETIDSFEILPTDTPTDTPTENGGCLIATATYGSELSPQVQQLRELRDNSLLKTKSGTSFMTIFNDVYYSFSPTIADLERENPVFREVVKIVITPLISSLSILNYVDMNSEAEVLGYGISLIILNVGMYFAAPAIIIYKIRK